MKAFLASLALPLLAATAPAPAPSDQANPPFTVMAIRSASPIHYRQMNGAGQRFWLGGSTSSYCPTNVGINCPPGNQTVFTANGNAMVCDTVQHDPLDNNSNNNTHDNVGCRSPRWPAGVY